MKIFFKIKNTVRRAVLDSQIFIDNKNIDRPFLYQQNIKGRFPECGREKNGLYIIQHSPERVFIINDRESGTVAEKKGDIAYSALSHWNFIYQQWFYKIYFH